MPSRNRKGRLVAAGMGTLLLTTSLTAMAGSASAAAAPGGATGVTKTSITIGGLVQQTSAVGYTEKQSVTGAKAYFDTVNAHGGINGRKIKFVGAQTDFGTPTKDLTAAKTLVEEKHVFAVVPVATTALAAGGTYLVKSGVPFFGWGVEPSFCNNTIGFGFTGCLVASTKKDEVATTPAGLLTSYLKKKGKYHKGITVALIGADNTAGSFGIVVSKAAFVADGWNVVYSRAAIPANGTTNYAPYVSTIMHAATGKPPEVMYYVTEVPETIGMAAAMKAAGFTGINIDPTSYTPAIVDTPSTDQSSQGRFTWIQWAATQAKTAATKKELTTIEKVTGKLPSVVSEQYTIGYLSAAVFTAIAKAAGKNLTRASFLKAANDGHFTFGIKGLMGPVQFPKDHDWASPCGSMLLIKGKNFTPQVPLTCYTDTPLSVATG
jgi:branched-chain amino acid transport system substrate-binding protein